MMRIKPKESGNKIPSFMLITYLVKEVFGTYFIEPLDWKFPIDSKAVGRTFFADRKKHKCAINERTLDNLLQIYRLALDGQSVYDAQRVSQELTKSIKEHFRLNIDYLMYFDDDGSAGEVPAEENGVITITTAAELAALSKEVAEGNNFNGKTVKLAADINLDGKAWAPIGRMINTSGTGENSTFKGNFDGQGHTIYNLNVDTVDEVSDTNKGAGLFGAITGNISNVNVVNATINTNHWAGVIAGSIEGSITNCSVTNATITCLTEKVEGKWDNGDKAGAIAGYATHGTIENCSVTDATITAYRDLGAIVGASYNSVVKGTVSNVTLIKENSVDYKGTDDDTTVNAYIPVELGNDYQQQIGYLDWEFMIEEYEIEPTDPEPPKTGDDSPLWLYTGMMVVSLCCLIIMLFVWKRKEKEEQS